MRRKIQLLDESGVARALTRLSYEIVEKNEELKQVVLAGIKTRGIPIANILAENIEKNTGFRPAICELDISFYRDDLTRMEEEPTVNNCVFPVDINNRHVIICDDVIFTGRTVRAAMDALLNQGRPSRISLAVLIDRGHRELPIRPDYVGKNVPTSKREQIKVSMQSVDGITNVELYEKE